MRRLTTEEFISKSTLIHGNKYDYSESLYKNNDTPIIIKCYLHGLFSIIPKNHLLGQKCRACGYLERNNNFSCTEKFIKSAKNIHGDRYDYDKVVYEEARKKVIITCYNHGDFKINPSNHLTGQGCRDCSFEYSSFRRSTWIKRAKGRMGIFYIIKCWNEFEEFFKLGITFRSIEARYSGILIPYKYKIIKELKSKDLYYIWNLEKRFKKSKIKEKYSPEIKFLGSKTECFKPKNK